MSKSRMGVLHGFSTVFKFTFKQHAGKKGYLIFTIGLALLLLLGIPLGMIISEIRKDATPPDYVSKVEQILVVDNSQTGYDFNGLQAFNPDYAEVNYQSAPTVEQAFENANEKSFVLVISGEKGYTLDLITPNDTSLEKKDLESYANFLNSAFVLAIMQIHEFTPEDMAELSIPINVTQTYATSEDPNAQTFVTLQYAIPYVLIMLLYLMLAIYGQTVGNSIVSEKSSKLMDTFLVSVRPAAIIGGKLTAISLSGIIQILSWIVGMLGGFAIGVAAVKAINPATTSTLVHFFGSLSSYDGVLSAGSIALTLILIICGFELYCAMFAIAGAISSKVEEVATTSYVVILCLVVAFMLALSSNSTKVGFLAFLPFTSLLCAPSLILFGYMKVWQSLISILLAILCNVIVIYIAGRLYIATALYKGGKIKLKDIVKLLKK